jgi:hypothetical protein
MQIIRSSNKQQKLNPEWLGEFVNILNNNGNKEKSKLVEKIFVETYFDNIQEGMNPKDALQKAKIIALCFFVLQQWHKTGFDILKESELLE